VDENETHFKREEDRKWRERVDDRLAALTAGETVQNDRLDDQAERLDEVDRTMRGDTEKDTGGLIERIHDQETKMSRLEAMLGMDSLGNPGIAKKVELLWKRELRAERDSENRWKFWTAIAVAILSLSGLVLRDFDKISVAVGLKPKTTLTAEKPSKRSGSRRRRHVAPPPPEATDGATEEAVQE